MFLMPLQGEWWLSYDGPSRGVSGKLIPVGEHPAAMVQKFKSTYPQNRGLPSLIYLNALVS